MKPQPLIPALTLAGLLAATAAAQSLSVRLEPASVRIPVSTAAGRVRIVGSGTTPTQGPGVIPSAADLAAAIDRLGSFDLPARIDASRTIRRAASATVVPLLAQAARQHRDGYVRYRALVLLAGFGDASAAGLMRDLMSDPNDRLRIVVYGWFEHHPDPAVLPALIAALEREQSEFVRPALLRALAAHSTDSRAQAAAAPLIVRGQDFFRGALIVGLGNYKATFAVPAIREVAKLDGPLQDDSVTALGEIGDASVHALLADLQRSGPREVQPSIAAALALLGFNVAANEDYLKKSLTFAVSSGSNQPLLRGVAHALAVLAIRDKPDALTALLDAGIPSNDPARAPIALALGLVALRNPPMLLDGLQPRADQAGALALLQEAFDMLSSEDYELERFYVAVRRVYWSSSPDSARRRLAEALIQKLEF
jgi:HEAT repeat protein